MGIIYDCCEKPNISKNEITASVKDLEPNNNRKKKLESSLKKDSTEPEYSSNLGNSNKDDTLEKPVSINIKDINSIKEEKVIKEGQDEERGEGEEGRQVEEQKERQIDIENDEEKEDDIVDLGVTVEKTKIIDPNLVNNQERYQKPYQPIGSSINIYKSTASKQGAVDLNYIQGVSSGNGNEIINNNIQQGSSISNIGNNEYIQNISAVPVTNNNIDNKQYTNNGNVDLGNLCLPIASNVPAPTENDLNNLRIKETGNFYYSNYNRGGVNSSSNNVGINNIGYNYANTQVLPGANASSTLTFGVQQRGAEYSAIEASKINENKIQNSYGSPVQSYSDNYSYTVPRTSKEEKH